MNKSVFNAAAFLGALAMTTTAYSAFLVPNGATAPFEDWSRSDADSLYAEWDVFGSAFGSPNSPDVGAFPTAGVPLGSDASVTGLEPAAFLTSGGNIYSFSSATKFGVAVPGYGYGPGYNTRIAVQIGVQGNPLDGSSLLLTYDDGAGTVSASPNWVDDRGLDGAKNEWIAIWDIVGFNPSSTELRFDASGSSMSLDTVAVDTFTQVVAFSPLPNAVPEPSTLVASALLLGGVGATGARRSSECR